MLWSEQPSELFVNYIKKEISDITYLLGYGMSTGVAKRVTISSEMEILATLVVNVNDSSKYRIEKSKQGFFLACGKCNIFSKDYPVLLKMTFSAAKERIRSSDCSGSAVGRRSAIEL